MRRPARAAPAVLGVALVAALWAAPPGNAAEEGVDRRLEEVERALERGQERKETLERKAETLGKEILGLRAETIATARAVQRHEAAITALERRLDELRAEEAAKRASLEHGRAQLAHTLAALARLARNPPEALIVMPAEPAETVRSALLLRAAVPPLKARARSLRRELTELAALEERIGARRRELSAAATALAGERARLDGLLERKQHLQERVLATQRQAAKRVDRLAAEAKDLRDLMARLETARVAREAAEAARRGGAAPVFTPPPGLRPIASARGSLAFPAEGRVVRRYGERTDLGNTSRGLAIETRPEARVIAPYDGQVVFAGPFRGYGQLLIISHGDGYHTLLAGLSRIDSVVGQWLLANEPVGTMGRPQSGDPTLYVELRHNGEPINPSPWLAARDEKVRG